MDPASIAGDTEQTILFTDWWTNGRTLWNQYTPFHLRWSRGIIRSQFCTYYDSSVMKRAVMKCAQLWTDWIVSLTLYLTNNWMYVLWWCHNGLHCNRLWHHHRTYTKWVRYIWWVKIIFLLSVVGPLCCVRNMIMHVLHWRTDYTLTPVAFWCLFPCMLHNLNTKIITMMP